MRKAFTLIELLVVVSIIALLIAILLPYMVRTRESARRTQCLSNLRQFQLGTLNYSLDNDGYYPDAKRDDGFYHSRFISTPLYEFILESSGGDIAIFTCPSDQSGLGNARYLRSVDTPPNGHGWRLGYVHLGGFDFSSYKGKTWETVVRMEDTAPDTKVIVDINYQPGPTVNNESNGMHGPKGSIITEKGVSLTPAELGIEGGNAVTADGAGQWQNIDAMQPYTAERNNVAWHWF
jgi:prepilin-type N-terminal cleavage/methylation domain-containing protein